MRRWRSRRVIEMVLGGMLLSCGGCLPGEFEPWSGFLCDVSREALAAILF